MTRPPLALLLLAVWLMPAMGAGAPKGYPPRVEQARANYRAKRDYASLKILQGQLRKGMRRDEVERLLGQPDYSPNPGEDYYSSEKKERLPDTPADAPLATVGLLLDYRNKDGKVTDRLQTFTMLALGR